MHRKPVITSVTQPRWAQSTHIIRPGRTSPIAYFHSSARLGAESFPNHYEVLELPATASSAEIKRQFFSLSKKHHPDISDSPNAVSRFHGINEAYHTLISPSTRQKYDRDWARVFAPHSHAQHAAGSHSSHSAQQGSFAGSRPPSGLSRRRTQFRGPPPSFYNNGGWGAYGVKREANMGSSQSTAHDQSQTAGSNQGQGGGFGPGQADNVFGGNDVPHFDSRAKRRTHDEILESQARRRASRPQNMPDDYDEGRRGQLITALTISGLLIVPSTLYVLGSGLPS